jgi:hypothetical protein
LEDLGLNAKMTLKHILKEWARTVETGITWCKIGKTAGL